MGHSREGGETWGTRATDTPSSQVRDARGAGRGVHLGHSRDRHALFTSVKRQVCVSGGYNPPKRLSIVRWARHPGVWPAADATPALGDGAAAAGHTHTAQAP